MFTTNLSQGVEIKSKEGKILEATEEKIRYGESYEKLFSHDVTYVLEKYPDRFGAIGLFTGIRGKGLVILDVDKNLAIHKKKWEIL